MTVSPFAAAWIATAALAAAAMVLPWTVRRLQARTFARTETADAARRAPVRVRTALAIALGAGVIAINGIGWPVIAVIGAGVVVDASVRWCDRRLSAVGSVNASADAGRRVRRLFRIATEPSSTVELRAGPLAAEVRRAHAEQSDLVLAQRRRWMSATVRICGIAAAVQAIAVGAAAVVARDRWPLLLALVWLGLAAQRRVRALRALGLA